MTEAQLRDAQQVTAIVSVQNRFNVSDRASDSIVDLCEQEDMAFLPWAPIRDAEHNRVVQQIAVGHDATPRQLALAWLLARSLAILPIPGTGSVSHLETNIEAAALTLSGQEVAAITQADGTLG